MMTIFPPTILKLSPSTKIEINGDAWHGTDLAFDCGRPMKVDCLSLTVPNLQSNTNSNVPFTTYIQGD